MTTEELLAQATARPWEAHATGTSVYASEIECGERTAYRPRHEIARLVTNCLADVALIVRAVNSYEAMRQALGALLAQTEAARIEGPYNVALVEALHAARAALALAEGE